MELLIVGAGGHGQCCLDIALDMGCFDHIAFLDDSNVKEVCGYPVIGKISDLERYRDQFSNVFIAIGNNAFRSELYHRAKQLDYRICSLISPLSKISAYASLGEGCVVFPFSVIESRSNVGSTCIIAAHVTINHDAWLCDGVLVNSNSIIRPNTHIGSKTRIGSGCVISLGTKIKEESDIPDGSIMNNQEEVKLNV